MTETADRVKAALADRYLLERELGPGGIVVSEGPWSGGTCCHAATCR